jgi:hypothetical protein
MGHRVSLIGIGLCSLVGALGCEPEEHPFEFGRADMEAFVYGTYSGTYIPPEASGIAMLLAVRPRDEATRNLACATREFADTDNGTPGLEVACDPTSSLAISASLLVNDGTAQVELDGWYTVFGNTLDDGNLWLTYRAAASTRLNVTYEADRWRFCDIRAGETYVGSCTIDARIQ